MSTNVTFNGSTYAVPALGDSGWGTVVSNYLIAISTGTLQKTGGTFTLTADADFGANYGLKSSYLKSRAANPSATGVVRLGNTELVSWRNAANSADLGLTVSAANALQFNGTTLLLSGLIVNADISPAAAIAYSKLNLTGAILNADLAGSIAYSKLILTGAILNADLAGSIAYSKLILTGAILNADLAGSIAYSKLILSGAILNADLAGSIAHSKMVAVTASKALVSDASGFVAAATTSTTELNYLSGVTSAVQTQIDAKTDKSTLTTKGDTYVATGASTVVRQGIGSDGQVLTADSAQANGLKWAAVPSAPSASQEYSNGSITATVSANAMTIALKDSTGANASAGSPVKIGFRSSTAATGTFNQRSVTAALSTVISSGSTAGFTNAVQGLIYVYAIDNAGTIELAWSGSLYDEGSVVTTTAEGGAGAATSRTILYSTTARTGAPIRLIARLKATEATAGTWATVPSEISNIPFFTNESVSARYNTAVALSLGTSAYTTIQFDTKSWDTHNAVTTGASWKFTAPMAGKFQVVVENAITSGTGFNGTTKSWGIEITKNGSTQSRMYDYPTSTNRSVYNGITDSIDMIAGDYISVKIWQDSGGAITLTGTAIENFIVITRVGNQ